MKILIDPLGIPHGNIGRQDRRKRYRYLIYRYRSLDTALFFIRNSSAEFICVNTAVCAAASRYITRNGKNTLCRLTKLTLNRWLILLYLISAIVRSEKRYMKQYLQGLPPYLKQAYSQYRVY